MRSGTSRDKRQQSRLLRGNANGFEICTVDHAAGGKVRLDATISYTDTNHEVGVYAHEHAELRENDKFIKVYSPSAGDECYVSYEDDGDGLSIDPSKGCQVDEETVAWWHMSCGRVLGVYDGRLIEYEPSTLAPLGLVVGFDELKGKRVVVVGSGIKECNVEGVGISNQEGMEGADCADYEGEEQAVLLVDGAGSITVVQPNEDGSYWRKVRHDPTFRPNPHACATRLRPISLTPLNPTQSSPRRKPSHNTPLLTPLLLSPHYALPHHPPQPCPDCEEQNDPYEREAPCAGGNSDSNHPHSHPATLPSSIPSACAPKRVARGGHSRDMFSQAAEAYADDIFDGDFDGKVVSSWGP